VQLPRYKHKKEPVRWKKDPCLKILPDAASWCFHPGVSGVPTTMMPVVPMQPLACCAKEDVQKKKKPFEKRKRK